MLKSVGFKDSHIMQWQVLRIGIILLISILLGALLSNPVSQISTVKVFEMMGATKIKFNIKPFEVYIAYPALILSMTIIASVLSTLKVKKITVQETNNLE